MIKYPKLIKTATEKLANVREDVKARDKELIDNPEFSITIGRATYTERVDGGTMMLEAISKCKTGETTAIGKFHGFELLVEKNFLGINYMVLRGKTEYKADLSTSPVGSMVKLENLFNGLHENIVDCQHFFRQIFLGYFSDIVQAFDTLRKNVCGDDYTSLHNPIVLSSVLPAYGMFHSIQILFL